MASASAMVRAASVALSTATILTLVGLPAGAAFAASPPMAVTISPTTGQAGVAADHVETYKAKSALANATIQTTIPATWTVPQTSDPTAPGYLSAARGTCASVSATPVLTTQPGGSTQVRITGVTCSTNARLTLTYRSGSTNRAGNYSFGPTTVQTVPTRSAVTIGSATISVASGPTVRFAVTSKSSSTVAGATFPFTVTPQDAFGETSSFSGTVAVSSTDHGAGTVLPANTSITGAHVFSTVLTTAGSQAITVASVGGTDVSGTLAGIAVKPASTSQFRFGALTPVVSTPGSTLIAGHQLSYKLSALDRFGNTTPGYAGSILTSSATDGSALLPARYTFVPGTDHGSHVFQLTPGTAGSETYRAVDAANAAISGTVTVPVGLDVLPAPATPLTATVGTPFEQALTAVGATGGVTWTSTTLPDGLSLDRATGVLSGTPTGAGGPLAFTVTATDAAVPTDTGSWTYSLAVGKGVQSVSFTSTAPADATVGGVVYAAQAVASPSGLAVTYGTEDPTVCTVAVDGTVSFVGGGTCTIDADQAGDADWLPATQAQQSFTVAPSVSESLAFTSPAPTDAVVGGAAYTPTAADTPSGLAVDLSIDPGATSVCSLDPVTSAVTFQTVGTCTIDASPGASAGYIAAQVQQSFPVGQGSEAVQFTSTAPVTWVAGPTYSPTVVGSPSNSPVHVVVDASSSTVCVFSSVTGALNMIGSGTCTLDATQDGDADWAAAPLVQQSFSVGGVRLGINVNPVDDPQSVPVPPNTNNCDPQTPTSGGCLIDPLDGTVTNLLDGTQTMDTTDPGFDPSLYANDWHWQIYKPPGLGSALYSSNGITGYHAPVLTILDSSLPELLGTGAGTYVYWTIQLTVTDAGGHTTIAYFKFQYTSSTLTLKLSTTCQIAGQSTTPQCQLSARHGLPATEPV